ncbi:MAG: ImmA/IrrE family metallo-endopeptidase [Ruthenibacterium sp.]
MTISYICKEVERVKHRYDEADPLRLTKAMGILVQYGSFGISEHSCKGFYFYCSRKRAIIINSDLPDMMQRVVLAHEIGHAILHRETVKLHAFQEVSLYDATSQYEYEANIFAAEYLLNDQEILEKLNESGSFFNLAAELSIPPEVLDFKFRILKSKGILQADSPILANSDFLKDVAYPKEC